LSDIFQEVEEDVRRERYEQIWKDYGNYIIALATVVVLAVAGWQAWQYYDLKQRQSISDRYEAAQQLAASGDPPKAEAAFTALLKDAPPGYASLAKFHLAGIYLAENKFDQAVSLLRELVQSSDPVISNTARLRLAWTTADASSRNDITALVQPLMAADSPWRAAASEVLAYLDVRDGARGTAQTEYQKLADDTTAPQSLRERARAIADWLKANPTANPAAPTPPTLPSLNPANTRATAPKPPAPTAAAKAPAAAKPPAPTPARGPATTQRTPTP
jgi:hypothetical protein